MLNSEHCMIVSSFIWTKHRNVTDRQMHGHFAFGTLREQDISLTGQFTYYLDISPKKSWKP